MPLSLLAAGLLALGLPARAADVLGGPEVTACLGHLRNAGTPTLQDAGACVRALTALARSRQGEDKVALERLAMQITALFIKERDIGFVLVQANGLREQAAKKIDNAVHAERVGTRLTGPNRKLGANYRQEAAKLQQDAAELTKRATDKLLEQVMATDVAVAAYSQDSANREVVIALAGSMFAVLDRSLPEVNYKASISKRWVQLKMKTPEQLAQAQALATVQLGGALAARIIATHAETENLNQDILREGALFLTEVAFSDAMETVFPDLPSQAREAIRGAWFAVIDGKITKEEIAGEAAKEALKDHLSKTDAGKALAIDVVEHACSIFQSAARR